jgi:hypothetical protein
MGDLPCSQNRGRVKLRPGTMATYVQGPVLLSEPPRLSLRHCLEHAELTMPRQCLFRAVSACCLNFSQALERDRDKMSRSTPSRSNILFEA